MLEIDNILCGDVLEKLKDMPDKSVNLIFADPPYNMQTEGNLLRTDGSIFDGINEDWDKFSSSEEYDKFSYQWLRECRRILKDDGTIWVIGSFQNIYRIGYIMQKLDFWILNDIIWSKPNAVPNFGGTRFQNSHETLLWCSKSKNSKFTFNYKTMKHLNNDKQDKSVWNIGICIGNERIKGSDGKKVHPTQKPEELIYKVIISSSKPNDIILDPFFGTGTTGAIAKKNNRHWIGIEKEPLYCNVAQKRIDAIIPVIDNINNLSYEVKPPKVSMQTLIKNHYLKINEILYDKFETPICTINENGSVSDSEDTLSIHKMSAKKLNRSSNNGWNYFYIKQNNKLIPIDSLRYKYREEFMNE